MHVSWSPEQYLAFEDDRTRPARDLLAALPGPEPNQAVDLGCGPGNSTILLAGRFPSASVLGIDSSPEMIAAARSRHPGLRFEVASIEAWQPPEPVGLIFSNAALHWVPQHEALLPSLLACLRPAGSLAIQMPDNLEEPAHQLMRAVAEDGPWAGLLANAAETRARLLSPHAYHDLLRPLCRKVDIFRITYHHELRGGTDAIVEWFKGSGLRPYLAPLDAANREVFLCRYRHELCRAYPAQRDGSVLLPFPRLFIVASR